MTDREDNLKRWAALAPGECEVTDSYPWGARARESLWYFNGRQANAEFGTRSFEPTLLSALIAAVRARGWHYNLSSRPDGKHAAWIPFEDEKHNTYYGITDEPCDALLQAYTVALEATEKKGNTQI